jgi:acetoin utilization deacetylase AcuC-like enzyme
MHRIMAIMGVFCFCLSHQKTSALSPLGRKFSTKWKEVVVAQSKVVSYKPKANSILQIGLSTYHDYTLPLTRRHCSKKNMAEEYTSQQSPYNNYNDYTSDHLKNIIEKEQIDFQLPYFPIYYNDVYEVILPPNHRFPMKKYRLVREQLQQRIKVLSLEERNKVQCEFRVSPLATVEQLETTHCPVYIDRYLRGEMTAEEIRNAGFPWSTSGVHRSLSSVGGTVAAATSVCEAKRKQLQKNKNKNNLWSAHVAGGTHHAFRDRGEGFCIFSDIAVAANFVLQEYSDVVRRILIIDLDVHQGNGNAVLFQDREDVLTFSMHCKTNYFSKKQSSDLDIELPPDCNDVTYLTTLNHWLKTIDKEGGNFDLIFYQAGVDILEDDRLGNMSISQQGISKRNEMIFNFANKRATPLVITMGGGYPKRDGHWNTIIDAHTNVYTEAHKFLRLLRSEQ